MSLDLYVDGDALAPAPARRRRRRTRASSRWRRATATASGWAAWPGAPSGWAATRSRSAPIARCRDVASRFDGDIVVLEPWRPFSEDVAYGPRIVHTVGRLADLADLGRPRRRPARRARRADLDASVRAHPGPSCARRHATAARRPGRGRAPSISRSALGSRRPRWPAGCAVSTSHTWFVSHLDDRRSSTGSPAPHPDLRFRARVGTGSVARRPRGAVGARSTVLDAHPSRPRGPGRLPPATDRREPAPCSSCPAVRRTGSGSRRRSAAASARAPGPGTGARRTRCGRAVALAVRRRRQAAVVRRATAHAGEPDPPARRGAVPAVGERDRGRGPVHHHDFDHVVIS